MIVFGVDVGLTGAVACIDHLARCRVEPLPTVALAGDGLIRRRIDGRALANLLLHMWSVGDPAFAVVEQVIAMGGQNNAVQTQGSLMRSLGTVEAVLEMLRLPPRMVYPRTWKKFYGLGAVKGESLRVARELYPSVPLPLAKDHNKAEALLIAHYGRKVLL